MNIAFDVVILAGGLGTRLRDMVPDLPKPMAPINGVPFLDLLMKRIAPLKPRKIVLSVGYRREAISNYFQNSFQGIPIEYCVEEEPLGTGGAFLKALRDCCVSSQVLLLNGDTFFGINYFELIEKHLEFASDITLGLAMVPDIARYGQVILEPNKKRIIQFTEKNGLSRPGFINAGVYVVDSKIANLKMPDRFSWENDILKAKLSELVISGFEFDETFIDIGVPEDYLKAQSIFKI